MSHQANGFFKWLLAPRALLGGVLSGFVACCVLGRAVSKQNPFENFQRFHTGISYLSLYYPTASQVRAVTKEAMNEGRILVIVGGNSVMWGSPQDVNVAWFKQLQDQLGDRYRVLNFAMYSLNANEIGAIAAEIALGEYSKVVFITYIPPGAGWGIGEPDGHKLPYFYWDAYYKGLLPPYPARDAGIAQLAEMRKSDPAYAELKIRSRQDGVLFCQDLWTTFSYRCAATVWCPPVQGSFSKPRRKYRDTVTSMAVAHRHSPTAHASGMAHLRAMLPARWTGSPGTPSGIAPDYAASPLSKSISICLTPQLRERTLAVVPHFCSLYTDELTVAERADYAIMYPETIEAIVAAGCQAVEVGRGYANLDFTDHIHISEEGARRMAEDIAPRVREMAERLGYLR